MEAFVVRIQDCRWLLVQLAAENTEPDGRYTGYPLEGPLPAPGDGATAPMIGWIPTEDGWGWFVRNSDDAEASSKPFDDHGLDVCGLVEVDDAIRKRAHGLCGVYLAAIPSPDEVGRSARFLLTPKGEPGHADLGAPPFGGWGVSIDLAASGGCIRILDRDDTGREVIRQEVPLGPDATLRINQVDGVLRIEQFADDASRG